MCIFISDAVVKLKLNKSKTACFNFPTFRLRNVRGEIPCLHCALYPRERGQLRCASACLHRRRHAVATPEQEIQKADYQIGLGNDAIAVHSAAALPGAHGSTRAMPTATKERERKDAAHAAAGRALALVRTTGGGRG